MHINQFYTATELAPLALELTKDANDALGMSLEHVAVEFLEDREVVLATWHQFTHSTAALRKTHRVPYLAFREESLRQGCSQQNHDNMTTCVSRTYDLVD